MMVPIMAVLLLLLMKKSESKKHHCDSLHRHQCYHCQHPAVRRRISTVVLGLQVFQFTAHVLGPLKNGTVEVVSSSQTQLLS